MKLLDLYEDLFQYVGCLLRAAKTQTHPEMARVHSEIKELLDQAARTASTDAPLASQVSRLELPLVFFVDDVIRNSRLRFASQWAEKGLAREKNEAGGEERFFGEFLDPDLMNPDDEAAERLAVYYVCLALGFRGKFQAQPEKMLWYMEQIFPRIRHWMLNDPRTKVSEEAYAHTDTRVLTEPPSHKLAAVAVAFVFLCLSVLVIYYALYADAVKVLTDSVETIVQKGAKNDAAAR